MGLNQELKEFKAFKKTFEFKKTNYVCKNDNIYCNDILIYNAKTDETCSETEEFLNVGFKLKNSSSKLLSNLFPYVFTFRGKKVSSIEAVLQGLKFQDIEEQNLVLQYSGTEANHVKNTCLNDWKETGKLFWQGKEIDRFSAKYQDFLDELFVSAIQNKLYRNALKLNAKVLIHSIGVGSEKETVLTRDEFEFMLNCLSAFVKKN